MNYRKKLSKFRKKVVKNLHVLVIFSGIILLWRGVRSLADELMFPEFHLISSVLSIFLGILIIFIYRRNLKVLIQ